MWLKQLVGFTTWSFGLSSHVVRSNHKWHIQLDFCNGKCHILALCLMENLNLKYELLNYYSSKKRLNKKKP